VRIQAITLIVEDIAVARDFYARVFDLPVHFEDAESVVFDFDGVLLNLLVADAAPDLIDPVPLAPASAGVCTQLTLTVDDVDAAAATLTARGVELIRGPEERPWGVRTATFRDPSGHVWELAK